MALRRTSRTSPSQRDMAPESLMLELKKRWFTVRSSTVTRCAPKRPVAAPNPVMLRIMDNLLSYGATMTLSNGDDSLKCADNRRPAWWASTLWGTRIERILRIARLRGERPGARWRDLWIFC